MPLKVDTTFRDIACTHLDQLKDTNSEFMGFNYRCEKCGYEFTLK